MYYALSPYVWTAPAGRRPHFRPRACEAGSVWDGIDLRPDCTKRDGYALIASPERIHGGIDLGCEPDRPSAAVRRTLRSCLGIPLRSSDLRAATLELLTQEAGGRKRVAPLRPSYRGWEIWLGGLFLRLRPIAGGSIYTDNFNRADSTSLGADWVEFLNDWQIVANRLTNVSSGGVEIIAHWSADLVTENHYVKASIETDSSTTVMGVFVRKDSSGFQTYYMTAHHFSGAQLREIQKCITGSYTAIGSSEPTTLTPTVFYLAYLEVTGSSLTSMVDGANSFSRTDTSITTGKRCGLEANITVVGTATLTFDNFEMADLGPGESEFPGQSSNVTTAILHRRF